MIKIYLFPLLALASIVCTAFLFYHFITKEQYRSPIFNHLVFLLLFVTFLTIVIPLPWTIYFFATNHPISSTTIFCSFWNYFQYSLCLSNLCLMTMMCFERHLFIFHSNIYQTRLHRIWLHYIPMIICLIYPLLFYILAIFATSCTPIYDYNTLFCIWPCYYDNDYWLGYYDLIVNNGLTNLLIPLLSLTLFLRIMKQKHSMKQQLFKWRRDRKLLIQLTSISVLYVIFWLPNNVVSILEMWYPNFLLEVETDLLLLGPSISNMFYPFICLLSYPELLCRNRRPNNRVAPLNILGK